LYVIKKHIILYIDFTVVTINNNLLS